MFSKARPDVFEEHACRLCHVKVKRNEAAPEDQERER